MKKLFGKIRKLFAISRTLLIMIVLVNLAFLCYHFFWIKMDFGTAIVLQLTAFVLEFAVSRLYEKALLHSNRKINKYTRFVKQWRWIIKSPIKLILFITCFLGIYVSTYYIRLKFFCDIVHWGVTPEQLEHTMKNAIVASPILGTIGSVILLRKTKKRHQQRNSRHNKKPIWMRGAFFI